MFAATSVSSFRALITYYPLAIVRTFFCFWQCQSHFRHFWKYFSRRADTRLCVCSRGAAAAGDCGDQDHGGQARLVEAGPWRLMTSGPRCGVLIVPATEVLLLCLVSGALPPHTHKIVNVTRQGIDVYRGSKRTSWCLFVVVMKQHQLGTLELSKLQPQSHMRVITAQECRNMSKEHCHCSGNGTYSWCGKSCSVVASWGQGHRSYGGVHCFLLITDVAVVIV